MEKLLDKIKVHKIFILELLFILFIYAFLFSFFENVKGELGREQEFKTDKDGDGLSDYFEEHISLTDPRIPNYRYVILIDPLHIPIFKKQKLKIYETPVSKIAKFLNLKEKIPSENIIKLEGNKATIYNFKEALFKIARKANKNDFVFLFFISHGEKGKIFLYKESLSYEKLNKWLDEIHARAIIIGIHACYSGSAIKFLKSGKSPRVIFTSSSENQTSIPHHPTREFFKAFEEPESYLFADIKLGDRNGYVSIKEAFLYAKRKMERITDSIAPQLSDPQNISQFLYLGEYVPE